MGETVTVTRGASNGAELRIELNRPESMNAWDVQLGLDLRAAVEAAAEDDSVRAVTITGAGRGFSSGADLKAGFEPTREGHPDVGTALRERYHPIITGIRRMPKPVLAAVNGPAGQDQAVEHVEPLVGLPRGQRVGREHQREAAGGLDRVDVGAVEQVGLLLSLIHI